ncbi:MAG: MarR family winged helix-turn-helix transcriptional regulator [Prevotellaceae bacterium]|jgi:DNA-binding MarR family transcriptional regulator|nr:MarR family winged helix-turn-helix transcriptional regulator [Prevotellaceae bacterium]
MTENFNHGKNLNDKDYKSNTGFLFYQLTNLWIQKHERFLKKNYMLSLTQYAILTSTDRMTASGMEITQTALAQYCKIEKMTLSKNVAKLVKSGYLQVCTNSRDARANAISLTDTSRKLLGRARGNVENLNRKFFSVLGYELFNLNQIMINVIELNDNMY